MIMMLSSIVTLVRVVFPIDRPRGTRQSENTLPTRNTTTRRVTMERCQSLNKELTTLLSGLSTTRLKGTWLN